MGFRVRGLGCTLLLQTVWPSLKIDLYLRFPEISANRETNTDPEIRSCLYLLVLQGELGGLGPYKTLDNIVHYNGSHPQD